MARHLAPWCPWSCPWCTQSLVNFCLRNSIANASCIHHVCCMFLQVSICVQHPADDSWHLVLSTDIDAPHPLVPIIARKAYSLYTWFVLHCVSWEFLQVFIRVQHHDDSWHLVHYNASCPAEGLSFVLYCMCLQVPICVQHPANDSWHLVHWIDSKACFGDDRTHSQQLEGQYRTYTNRYGPGVVIYWFGYVEGLENDSDVMILERFPRGPEVMQLPRLAAVTKQ